MKQDKKHFLSEEQLRGEFLRHEPCPECGSENNVAVYRNEQTGKETKYCHTPGCDYKITTASLFRTKQPGEALPLQWCEKKGLTEDVAKRYRITREDKRIYFGLASPNGRLSGVSYRNYAVPKEHDKHFGWQSKTSLLYGMDACTNGTDELIIVSGLWDAPSAYMLTGINAVSIINGDKGAKNDIEANYQWLKQFKTIYIVFDNDEPGQTAAALACKLLGYKAKNVVLPELVVQTAGGVHACKDSNDYLRFKLHREYKDALEAAKTQTTPLLWGEDADELYAKYIAEGIATGWSTGIKALDEMVTFRPNEFTLLFGAPGRGKSSLARFFLYQVAMQGIRPYYFSFEDPVWTAMSHLVRLFGLEGTDPKTASRAVREKVSISNLTSPDPEELCAAIECAYVTYGCQFFVIDHVTWLINKQKDERKAATLYLDGIATLVKDLPIHVFVVSHNKPASLENVRGQDRKNFQADWEEWLQPTQRDAMWSSAFEQVAWNIWGWKKPDSVQEPGRLYVLKNRVGGMEKQGVVILRFDKATSKFTELSDYAKTGKGKQAGHSNRWNDDIVRERSGEETDGDVLSLNRSLRQSDSPVPSSEAESYESHHAAESHVHEGQESHRHGDNGRDATVHAEVHPSRLASGLLHSCFRLNTGIQGGYERRFSDTGGNFYAPASSIVQKIQDSLSETKPLYSAPQRVDLRKVGGIVRNPVVHVQPDIDSSEAGTDTGGLAEQPTFQGKWTKLLLNGKSAH